MNSLIQIGNSASYAGILEIVLAVISGGLITALISSFFESRKARSEAERQHLDDALRNLYGPVFRLLTDAQMCIDLNHSVQKEYTEYFNKPWHESARDRVQKQAEATLQTANQYVYRAEQHVEDIISITADNWHLIDLDDIEIFDDIRRQRARFRVEKNTPTAKEIPFEVSQKLGDLHYLKPEWVATIKSSYESKLARYRELSGC
jgi:hypothetical protein